MLGAGVQLDGPLAARSSGRSVLLAYFGNRALRLVGLAGRSGPDPGLALASSFLSSATSLLLLQVFELGSCVGSWALRSFVLLSEGVFGLLRFGAAGALHLSVLCVILRNVYGSGVVLVQDLGMLVQSGCSDGAAPSE